MRNDDIDDVFQQRSAGGGSVDPALLGKISGAIGASLRPVRPLPASWVLILALMAACLVLATAGARLLGIHGIQRLSAVEIGLIFPTVTLLIGMAAATYVSAMIPGSRRPMNPWVLLIACSLLLVTIFAVVFHDYQTDRFVPAGLKCLAAGLLQAIPVGLSGWLILCRGYAVNRLAAGLAGGALAGLAGVTMLELHCANLQALHVMVWHTAVVPLSGAFGALLLWITRNKHATASTGRQ